MKRNSKDYQTDDVKQSSSKMKKSKFKTSKKKSNKDYPSSELKEARMRPNDLSWYVPSDQILNDVARIPYSFPVGVPFRRHGVITSMIQDDYQDHAIPGILTMRITPTLGNAKEPNDAINIAANGMYTFVRHTNSGSRNYDANDLFIYCLAIDSLYYIIAWASRLYATMRMYSQANRYLPRHLIEEQRVDYDDLLNNLPTFRAGLNMRINRIATLYVPAVLPIFARHSWLFQNYYIEGESEKDQIYQFAPYTWYEFKYDSDGAGMLKAHIIPEDLTVAQLFSIIDSMIDPIIADEDFNIISGDLYKAYQGNILKLAEVPDDLTANLIYNEEVLLQIKNAKPKSVRQQDNLYLDNFFDVIQAGTNKEYIKVETPENPLNCYRVMDNVNSIIAVGPNSSTNYKERLSAMWNEWSKHTLLTTPHSDVTPAENMINTRLTMAFDLSPDLNSWWGGKLDNIFFGSEWAHTFQICSVVHNINTGLTHRFHHTYERVMLIDALSANLAEDLRSQIPMISAFKYHPEIALILDPDGISGSIQDAGRSVFEIDNYTLISSNVVGRLHATAIMGEYNIPKIALIG